MTEDRINLLADRWLKGSINPPEREELESWYSQYEGEEQEIISDLDEAAYEKALFSAIVSRAGIEPALLSEAEENQKASRIRFQLHSGMTRWAVAAAVATIIFGVWFFTWRFRQYCPPNFGIRCPAISLQNVH